LCPDIKKSAEVEFWIKCISVLGGKFNTVIVFARTETGCFYITKIPGKKVIPAMPILFVVSICRKKGVDGNRKFFTAGSPVA
jgi:hypothetical protein